MRDPKRLWRIRPDINVVPVPPHIRKINSKGTAVLNARRAGNRGSRYDRAPCFCSSWSRIMGWEPEGENQLAENRIFLKAGLEEEEVGRGRRKIGSDASRSRPVALHCSLP
jgi:hypothetical protein